MTLETDYITNQDGDLTIVTRQDVEPILEWNKARSNEFSGYTPSRDLQHVASIPMAIYQLWQNLYGPDCVKDRAFLKKMLNDPEWRHLRVGSGHL